ncbi:MAG: nuclear transport factor 2 family protein [Sandaracinaceae bacterium]
MRAFAVALVAAGCGAGALSASARTTIETDVSAVLDDWHAAAAAADEDRYFDHLAENAVFLGTDATERWTKDAFRAYAHPHFARGRAWTFRALRRGIDVSPSGSIAWFDEDLETENLGPARGSGVLVRGDDGVWRIAQYNLAITIPNDEFAAVREVLGASAR